MSDETDYPAIETLKHRARQLQRQAQEAVANAIARLRTHPDFKADDDATIVSQVKRRHALFVVAKELGFTDWPHATKVLCGREAEDYGTMLYPRGGTAHTNIWSASYDEARTLRDETDGYLLPYRNQFIVVEDHYIRTLDLDLDDADWAPLKRDWLATGGQAARSRLYAKLLEPSASP